MDKHALDIGVSQPQVIDYSNHLLILRKPAGMLTQPSIQLDSLSLEEWGKKWIAKHFHKKGNVFLEAVHRLDRSVSGIVLFARTSKALSRLNQAQREGRFRKTYQALVEGNCHLKEEVLEDYLVHDSFRAQIVSQNGKKARLLYRVLKHFDRYSLLEIELETGRYHQIRVQLSSRGHPVVGDKKYGSRISFTKKAIALHHFQLEVPDPITQKPLLWTAPSLFSSLQTSASGKNKTLISDTSAQSFAFYND